MKCNYFVTFVKDEATKLNVLNVVSKQKQPFITQNIKRYTSVGIYCNSETHSVE